jgi:hypothetical protein
MSRIYIEGRIVKYQLECLSSKNEIFYAHRFGEDKNIVKYKCGVCIYGDLFFDKKTKLIININSNKCKSCKSLINVQIEGGDFIHE